MSAAKAIGYDSLSGASASKVAALAHYGLLERNGNVYKNSDLAGRIHHFVTEQEKKDAILEAVMKPKLFNALVEEYKGRAIPSTLSSVLIRKHKISSKVANKAVQTFKDSVEFAGIYENGVLVSSLAVVPKRISEEVVTKTENQGESLEQSKPKVEHHPLGAHSVPLPSGAIVSYPLDVAFYLQTNPAYIKALEDLEKVVQEAIAKKSK
ncbi:MAG: hypothetical protein AAB588_03585 [Patescibacteria group bacterium]